MHFKTPEGKFQESFHTAVTKFTEEFLTEDIFDDILSKVAFLHQHPDINGRILEDAVLRTQLKRKDVAICLPNPIEVHQAFMKS